MSLKARKEQLRMKTWMGKVFFEKKVMTPHDAASSSGSSSKKTGAVVEGWSDMLGIGRPHRVALAKARMEVLARKDVVENLSEERFYSPMDDTLLQPCMAESEKFPDLFGKVSRERFSIDAAGRFEYDC